MIGAAAVAIARPGPRRLFAARRTPADAQQNDKRWLAVAPGRVEPPSGIIKVAAPTMGIVSKVLVKVNDTVFAGEPLILLNDDDIQARYAAAETQAGDAQRLRDEQPATGKADERRQRRGRAWPTPRPRCSTRRPRSTRPRSLAGQAARRRRPDQCPRRRWRAPRTNWRSAKRRLRAASTRRCRSPLEAQVASARGDLAFARVNLEKLKIRAPIDGTVLQININPGELAAPSALQPLLLDRQSVDA